MEDKCFVLNECRFVKYMHDSVHELTIGRTRRGNSMQYIVLKSNAEKLCRLATCKDLRKVFNKNIRSELNYTHRCSLIQAHTKLTTVPIRTTV